MVTHPLLADALARRGRTWGERNAAILREARNENDWKHARNYDAKWYRWVNMRRRRYIYGGWCVVPSKTYS